MTKQVTGYKRLCYLGLLVVLVFGGVNSNASDYDIDRNGEQDPLTDGLLVLRYLFGFSGDALVSDALGAGATVSDPDLVAAHIDEHFAVFDIDGNGQHTPLSDGLLLLRYLFGFSGQALVSDAIGVNAVRVDGEDIIAFIETGTTASNAAPAAVDDVVSSGVTQDVLYASVTSLIANDTDADGNPLTATPGSLITSQNGLLVLASDGSYTYLSAANFSGTDTVSYNVSDGIETDTGVLSITVATESTSNTCEGYAGAFNSVSDLVSFQCNETYLSITSETGLPFTENVVDGEKIMVGITSWIQRVPIPYTFEWEVPLNPDWAHITTEASARGPIAVAIDGVPVFHYERRPDVSTALSNYLAENDTVLAGELDQCGGHAGQGDDYHYHYAPVCLLDDHDLSQPIAFGLDGAPVYFGQGGTDYYGNGRFNDWNNFPEDLSISNLDDCNAIMQADGSYVHYSTKVPPYLIGCHHGPFDSALQIEPRPMSGREQGTITPLGGQYGEPISTLISDFSYDGDGKYTLKFNALDGSNQTSSIIYQQTSTTPVETCWEFEFRTNESQVGEVRSACRNNMESKGSNKKKSFVHNHAH